MLKIFNKNKSSGKIENTGIDSVNITGTVKGDLVVKNGVSKEELTKMKEEILEEIKNNGADKAELKYEESQKEIEDKDKRIKELEKQQESGNTEEKEELQKEIEKLRNEKEELINLSNATSWLHIPLNEKVMPENIKSIFFKHIFKRAKKGNKNCQYVLGMWYKAGTYTEINYQEAIYWLFKSYENGKVGKRLENIPFNIASIYAEGEWEGHNYETAEYWYYIAIKSGCLYAINSLGILYLNEEWNGYNPKNAVNLFNELRYNYPHFKGVSFIHNLAICYAEGLGVEKNEIEAFNLFKQAVKKDKFVYESWVHLSICYEDGIGTQKDKIKAEKCEKKAERAIKTIERHEAITIILYSLFLLLCLLVFIGSIIVGVVFRLIFISEIGFKIYLSIGLLLCIAFLFIFIIFSVLDKYKQDTKIKITSGFCCLILLIQLILNSCFISTYNYKRDNIYYNIKSEEVFVIGAEKDIEEIIIPLEIDGKPVCIEKFGVFYKCNKATIITLPYVGYWYSGKVDNKKMGKICAPFGYLFREKDLENTIKINMKSKYLDGDTEKICSGDFFIPTSLKSVTILSGVIGYGAFYNCYMINEFVIGKDVTEIEKSAFYNCSGIQKVFYNGTKDEWNKIQIDDNNGYLTNATRYYFSESKPVEKGNYWHYEDNKPVIWE